MDYISSICSNQAVCCQFLSELASSKFLKNQFMFCTPPRGIFVAFLIILFYKGTFFLISGNFELAPNFNVFGRFRGFSDRRALQIAQKRLLEPAPDIFSCFFAKKEKPQGGLRPLEASFLSTIRITLGVSLFFLFAYSALMPSTTSLNAPWSIMRSTLYAMPSYPASM